MDRRHVLPAVLFSVAALAVPASCADMLERVDKAAQELIDQLPERGIPRGAAVAVLPFEDRERRATELGRMLADSVTEGLVRTGRFTTLDREYLSRLLREIKLGAVGLTDQRTALQLGKFSGARYLLLGSLEKVGRNKVSVSARLLDTEKAALVASLRARIKLDKHGRELQDKLAVLDEAAALMPLEQPKEFDATLLGQEGRDGCHWVEARSSVAAGSDREAAKAAAVSLARRKAVARVSGKTVEEGADFSDKPVRERIEEVLRAVRSGRIREEKILKSEEKDGLLETVLQACVLPLRETADKGFQVELMLNQRRFSPGQEARAIVTSTRDAYIFIYSVDFDLKAYPVFPVPGSRANRVEPGHPFDFPSDEDRAAGTRLTAELPKGEKSSVETLRVLAIKQNPRGLLAGISSYPEIVAKLEASGQEWTEDVRVFSISKH